MNFRLWRKDIIEEVERGLVDLVFYGVAAPSSLRNEQPVEERFVCVVARNHPLAGEKSITLDEYLRCSHIVVNVADEHQPAFDRHLETLGTPRKAALTIPYHVGAELAVPGTMLVATLPQRLVSRRPAQRATTVIPAPAEIELMSYYMCWHPRLDDDPAQRWLRNVTRATAATIWSTSSLAAVARRLPQPW